MVRHHVGEDVGTANVSFEVAQFLSRGAATDNSPGRKPGESWRSESQSPEGQHKQSVASSAAPSGLELKSPGLRPGLFAAVPSGLRTHNFKER